MKLPEQTPFEKANLEYGYNPVEPIKTAPGIAKRAQDNISSFNRKIEADYANYSSYLRDSQAQVGQPLKDLGALSTSLGKVVEDTAKILEDNQKADEMYASFFGKPDPVGDAKGEELDQAATELADENATTAVEIEAKTGNKSIAQMAYTYGDGGMSQAYVAQKGSLLQAQTAYGAYMVSFLESNAIINVNGQRMTAKEASTSGDYGATQAAIAAGRQAFFRQYDLGRFSKKQVVKTLGQTILATDSSLSQSRVSAGIKATREETISELTGMGYDLAQTTGSGSAQALFSQLSQQFYTRQTGLTRGEANKKALEALISGYEDAENIDGLRALLRVEKLVGNKGTRLGRQYGSLINAAIERAEQSRENTGKKITRDIKAGMYEKLAGAGSLQERTQIIQDTVKALENGGRFEDARVLQGQFDELSVAGNSEFTTAKLAEGLRNGTVTSKDVQQAVLLGEITQAQAKTLTAQVAQVSGSKLIKDSKVLQESLKGYQNRFKGNFLTGTGLREDTTGNILSVPGLKSQLSPGDAQLLISSANNQLRQAAQAALAQLPPDATETQRLKAMSEAMQDWYQQNFVDPQGTFYPGQPGDLKNVNATRIAALTNLANESGTLSQVQPKGLPKSVLPQPFYKQLSPGMTIPDSIKKEFRPLRGDKVFSEEELVQIRKDWEKGLATPGLNKTAQQLGMTPLELLNQQSGAYNLSTYGAQSVKETASSYSQLLSAGFTDKTAVMLSAMLPESASGTQVKQFVSDLQSKHPAAYRTLKNPYATDRDLRRAIQNLSTEKATPSGSRVSGNAKERTISLGKELVSMGYRPWQHPDFDVNKGYTGSGKERVGAHAENSAHYHQEAFDFPLSHNSYKQLDQLYEWLNANKSRYGIRKVIWRAPGHYTHLHVELDHTV